MIQHEERLKQIWSKLWVLIKDPSPEARDEEEKLLKEMDELDPCGTGILEYLRENDNGV